MKLLSYPFYCGGRILVGLSSGLYQQAGYFRLPAHRVEEINPTAKDPKARYRFLPMKQNEGPSLTCSFPLRGVEPETVKREMRKAVLVQNGVNPITSRIVVMKGEEVVREAIIPDLARYWPQTQSDYFQSIPDNLEDFQYLLCHMLDYTGDYKFIHAVTNDNQETAADFLLASGFKNIGEGRKNSYSNSCINWIGDSTRLRSILNKQRDRYNDHVS